MAILATRRVWWKGAGLLSDAVRGIVAAFALTLVCPAVAGVAAGTPGQIAAGERQIKAVLLYNLVQFVTWPDDAFESETSPWIVGVLGEDPIADELDKVFRAEVIGGRPFIIRHYRRVEQIDRCHLLFISRSEDRRLEAVFRQLEGRSILTAGETENFVARGGMVRLAVAQGKVHFRIHPKRAAQAGLVLSSKLLRLSEIVEEQEAR